MKQTILAIAANPQGTNSLRLDRELRVINEAIDKSQLRDRFDLQTVWATRTIDILPALLKHRPRIVHFCGHGEGKIGLVLEDEAGQVKLVSSEALAGLFAQLSWEVECVLLNACHSVAQAQAIAQHINYAIGMSREILDDMAIAFSRGFYTAISNGESIERAYEFGKSQAAIEVSGNSTIDSRKMTLISDTLPAEQPLIQLFIKEQLTKFDNNISSSPSESAPSADFLYDAYICYVDREPDSRWVWDILLPKLEGSGLKIAVAGDVDAPGVAQIVNIEQGIRQAKRTIIVLSDAYLADNMAEFESTLGQTMGIQAGTYRLLPIKAMPFDSSCLPTRLSMLTILDLSDSRRVDRGFDRLVQALKNPLPTIR
jgi:hypothetical protein